jgi:hypothetical protein
MVRLGLSSRGQACPAHPGLVRCTRCCRSVVHGARQALFVRWSRSPLVELAPPSRYSNSNGASVGAGLVTGAIRTKSQLRSMYPQRSASWSPVVRLPRPVGGEPTRRGVGRSAALAPSWFSTSVADVRASRTAIRPTLPAQVRSLRGADQVGDSATVCVEESQHRLEIVEKTVKPPFLILMTT